MYTSVNRRYADLFRTWHKKSLKGLPTSSRQQQKNNTKEFKLAGETMNAPIANPEEFPPFVDLTEEQEVCIDPIRALEIPRSQYHLIRELVLCRKGITRLHSNVQLLKNLDTLIIRHNRLRKIDFLLPKKDFFNSNSLMICDEDNIDAATPHGFLRGCRLLRNLYASHNCIQTLDGDVPNMRHLEVLLLAHNCLSNLRAVSAQLKPLRRLRQLDLRGNPLCDELGYRLFIIHEHPHIEVLDRRAVRENERREAKAHFISVASRTRAAFGTAQGHDMMALEKVSVAGKGDENINSMERVAHPTMCSFLVHQEQEEGNQIDGAYALCKKNENTSSAKMASKTVAFLSTFVEAQNKDDSLKAPRRALFKPSACASLLEKKVRRFEKKRLKQVQKEEEICRKAENELCEKYQAFHATWAMSLHGMLLSSDNAEATLKTTEVSVTPVQASADANSTNHQHTMPHRKLPSSRQQCGEPAAKTTATNNTSTNLILECKQLELPQLPPLTGGRNDHSVLFDALLGRSNVVEARIGKNNMCLPENSRLKRMNKLLTCTNEFLQQQIDILGGREKKILLLRDICQQKDALIPEPWEYLPTDGRAKAKTAEQIEYLNMIARSFFTSAELNALEGQFMTGGSDVLQAQEIAQRGKKQLRKDKRSANDLQRLPAATTAVNSTFSGSVDGANPTLQRYPGVLSATGVEIGRPEKATLMRVLNMLDAGSGAWDLDLGKMVAAFCKEYPNKATKYVVDDGPKKKDDQRSLSTLQRPQRPLGKSRTKSERRSVATVVQSNAAVETPGASTTPVTQKEDSLSLAAVLLDFTRYVPFVESRLGFFRANCEMAALNCSSSNGSSGDLLREWFAKLQLVSTHLEKLLKAAKRSKMTKDDMCVSFVPLDNINVYETEAGCSFFGSRAAS